MPAGKWRKRTVRDEVFSYSSCLKSSVECCWSRVLVSRGRFLVILQSWIRLHCGRKASMGTISPDHGYGAQISHIRCGCPRASWYYPQFRGDLKILLSSFSNLPACFLPNLALCWWYQVPEKPEQLWLPKRKLDGHWKKIRRKLMFIYICKKVYTAYSTWQMSRKDCIPHSAQNTTL